MAARAARVSEVSRLPYLHSTSRECILPGGGRRDTTALGVDSREFRTQLVALLKAVPDFDTESRRTALLTYLPPALQTAIPRDPSPAIDLQKIVAACAGWQPPPGYPDPHPLALLVATGRAFAPPPQQAAWTALIAAAPPALGPIPIMPRPRVPLAVGRGSLLFGGLGLLVAGLAVLGGWPRCSILPHHRPPTPLPTEGEDMVSISEGLYMLGTDDPQAEGDETPPTLVNLKAFHLDRYEVTNQQYRRCRDQGPCTPPIGDSITLIQADYNNYPVVGVDAAQAARYCRWRGARLPQEAEWERAVRGRGSSLAALHPWPWGSIPLTPDATAANLDLINGKLAAVGSYHAGRSLPEDNDNEGGIEDLIGNVWEWTSSIYTPDGYQPPFIAQQWSFGRHRR